MTTENTTNTTNTTENTTETAEPVQPAEPTDGEQAEQAEATTEQPVTDDQGATDDDGQQQGGGRAHKQAATYRRQLRDTEAERDALSAKVEDLQRREAEQVAGRVLRNGAGLWADGTTVADVLTADGEVDPDLVLQRAGQAAGAVGLERKTPRPDPTQGGHGGFSTSDSIRWAEAMKAH